MFYEDIEQVIPETNIVCVSPHYDDFLFFLGGYVRGMKKADALHTKKFTNINAFSRSNYQERDIEGNKDQSLKRVQYASGIRMIEDLEGLDALLGEHNYTYALFGEEESQVRGKPFNEGDGEMEMAFGSYETMDGKDRAVFERLIPKMREILMQEDTALILPFSMKGHIDHFLVREAGVHAMKEPYKAAVYFAEDKPYAGLMDEAETRIHEDFMKEFALEDRAFAFEPDYVLDLAYAHYPSQIDTIYDKGIKRRADELSNEYRKPFAVDRLYRVVVSEKN